MFNQFTIIKLKQQFETIVLKFQIYCISNDTQAAGYKSLSPLAAIDNKGYEEQLTRNKDLREEIHCCQIQLQALLEVVEMDNESFLSNLGHVKPPAKPVTRFLTNDSGDDIDTYKV